MNSLTALLLSGLLWALPALPSSAQNQPPVTPPRVPQPPAGGDQENLFEQLQHRKNPQVSAEQAARCSICKKPLYLHSDGFKCAPPDKEVLEIKAVPLDCPVCTQKFTAAEQGNINSGNGMDRDFCRHSLGNVTVHASVWICPDCGYAAIAKSFGKELDGSPLSEQTKALVRSKLSAATRAYLTRTAQLNPENPKKNEALSHFGSWMDQAVIPDWIKYQNALTLLENQKLPHALTARLHLEAAHANRRHLCSDLAVGGLHPSTQIFLGHSLALINRYLQAESLSLRQAQGETILDPTQPEREPEILERAARIIFKKGEQLGAAEKREKEDAPQQLRTARFTVMDMYILNIRHAGFLDRLGRLGEAQEALERARNLLDPSASLNPDPNLEKIIKAQFSMLREAVEERIQAIDRQRRHLYLAADHLMQALFFNEQAPEQATTVNAYLIAELLRRDARELRASLAWFRTTLDLLVARKGKMPVAQWNGLNAWSEESMAEIRKRPLGRALDEKIWTAINAVRQREQLSPLPKEGEWSGGGETPAGPANPASAPKSPDPARTAATLEPGSRATLLHTYYKALQRYVQEHQANPATLSELVKGGTLTSAEACLDPSGKTILCPATQKKLLYSKGTRLGDAAFELIFPSPDDPDQTRLYGDGRIGLPEKK